MSWTWKRFRLVPADMRQLDSALVSQQETLGDSTVVLRFVESEIITDAPEWWLRTWFAAAGVKWFGYLVARSPISRPRMTRKGVKRNG